MGRDMASARLILLGSIAAVIAALLVGLLWYRGQAISAAAERDTARAEVKTAAAVNAVQKATMDRLTAFREIDDKLMTGLQARLGEIATQAGEATTALRELERTSADAKAYLAVPVPADLGRVLNRRAVGGGTANRQ